MFRPKSTFEQWRIFQAVVDCGGYAQAAEALNKVTVHRDGVDSTNSSGNG